MLRFQARAGGVSWLERLFWNPGYSFEKLPRGDNLCVGPLSGEIPQIASNKIVSAGRLGTVQKNVVVRIKTDMHVVRRLDSNRRFPNSVKNIRDLRFGPIKAGATHHFFIFREDFTA